MFDKAINTKKQGDIGLAVAIAWFAQNGYTVSVPLTDSQDYDLIVDNGTLSRVQVKTGTYSKWPGSYSISLTVKGGNRSWKGTVKHFDPTKVELLFVLTEDGSKYLIPTTKLQVRSMISVGKKYNDFRIN